MSSSSHLMDDDATRIATDLQRRLNLRAVRREPLARLTTMRVGGPADLFAEVRDLHQLRALIRFTRSRSIPTFLLGRGSDLVISDRGIAGLVVQVRAQVVSVQGDLLTADAGVPMARVATAAKDAGLSGMEFGLAIPGTVGGAVWANAGAHDGDVRGVLVSANVIDEDGMERTLDPDALGLAYRESSLKHDPLGRPRVVTRATFRLAPEDPAVIGQRLDEIRRWRQAHQPLGIPSAGSFFRNPPGGPSAGALIDELGLKGTRVGGASVSPKHANFLVNDAAGTATDVRLLADHIRAVVQRERGIRLQEEAVYAGDWDGWVEGVGWEGQP
jgi:UDP-N-acetylmuramate dehydrogenase